MIGPQLFLTQESPVYQTGWLSIMICYAIGITACATLRGYLIWVNKKRERLNGGSAGQDESEYADASVDKTDKEQTAFVYVY